MMYFIIRFKVRKTIERHSVCTGGWQPGVKTCHMLAEFWGNGQKWQELGFVIYNGVFFVFLGPGRDFTNMEKHFR